MKPVTIYGFKCLKKDEKILMKRINDYLATHNRTTSRSKNPSLLRAYAPLTLKHFYWNLNKEMIKGVVCGMRVEEIQEPRTLPR